MDQNQLSAYVEQDAFPLFFHAEGSSAGEFGELVQKVLTERISLESGFLDALHMETAGHPFLTVNVLVELVDWLIDSRRPSRGLKLRAQDVEEFSQLRLTAQRLQLSSEYDFFRAAISEALSPAGARMNRWLHAVYGALRGIALHSPQTSRVSLDDFAAITAATPDRAGAGIAAEDLLRTGVQANFLSFDGSMVGPRIQMLGRLAGVTRPRAH
jgi:hypothetical protein